MTIQTRRARQKALLRQEIIDAARDILAPEGYQQADIAAYNSPESNGMRALGILRGSVVACIDARKFRKVDPDVTSRVLWSAVHGITALLIQTPNFASGEQQKVIDALIDTLIEGL